MSVARSEYAGLLIRYELLLERVTVLERALEEIASSESGTTLYLRDLAREALDAS